MESHTKLSSILVCSNISQEDVPVVYFSNIKSQDISTFIFIFYNFISLAVHTFKLLVV